MRMLEQLVWQLLLQPTEFEISRRAESEHRSTDGKDKINGSRGIGVTSIIHIDLCNQPRTVMRRFQYSKSPKQRIGWVEVN